MSFLLTSSIQCTWLSGCSICSLIWFVYFIYVDYMPLSLVEDGIYLKWQVSTKKSVKKIPAGSQVMISPWCLYRPHLMSSTRVPETDHGNLVRPKAMKALRWPKLSWNWWTWKCWAQIYMKCIQMRIGSIPFYSIPGKNISCKRRERRSDQQKKILQFAIGSAFQQSSISSSKNQKTSFGEKRGGKRWLSLQISHTLSNNNSRSIDSKVPL